MCSRQTSGSNTNDDNDGGDDGDDDNDGFSFLLCSSKIMESPESVHFGS